MRTTTVNVAHNLIFWQFTSYQFPSIFDFSDSLLVLSINIALAMNERERYSLVVTTNPKRDKLVVELSIMDSIVFEFFLENGEKNQQFTLNRNIYQS